MAGRRRLWMSKGQRRALRGAAGFACSVGFAGASGCVERELVATSEPPGALVTLNGTDVSRTPLETDFQWYGTYDATVRADGYETLRTRTPVIAPPWLWFPFDLVAEVLPVTIHDVHRVHYKLTPTMETQADPDRVVQRARELQSQLESGVNTVEREGTTRRTLTTREAQ